MSALLCAAVFVCGCGALTRADIDGAARGGIRLTAAPLNVTALSHPAIPAHWTPADDQKRVCVYTLGVNDIGQFASLIHRQVVDCAMVYGSGKQWSDWSDPWFVTEPKADLNWAAWVRESPALDPRQLVISLPMIPSVVARSNWRTLGAAGAYTAHAKQLARNLIASGLGTAIIRLGWEANGAWNADNIGKTPKDYANWVRFWRQTVIAMRSVPGAHFLFDWCVNNGYPAVPFRLYYPGNDVVNIIGDDAFDWAPAGQNRWNTDYDRPDGLGALVEFAKQHRKPISLPEWGVAQWTPAIKNPDDAQYVNGIARLVRDNNTAYQTYFFAHAAQTDLPVYRRSLKAYRAHFGTGGDSTGLDDGTDEIFPR